MDTNLNTFFAKLTNFKIKFTENPSPTQISNANLYFVVGQQFINFNTVMYDPETDSVIIEFEEKDDR